MTPVKMIIDKKREGKSLGTAEIRDFISGFVSGEIPDYQMSALAMAICCRGMTERETSDLIEVMMNSGRCLKWNFPTADKHSTGGVGDKLSFLVQPIVAACGIAVPSLTGRGLGITGGTADKLESIPGYNASLSLEEFEKVVSKIGLSMTVQTSEITPADKKLYALRDVTGTVASIPLITASILSKKLAEGADVLVFDVKCGKGAFMKTPEEANALAESLVVHARRAGRKCAAIVTDMNAPLGYAVGNANEIVEAFVALGSDRFGTNRKVPRDVVDTSLKLASAMVSLSLEIDETAALEMCKEKLASGAALKKFEEMIAAQGGSLERFDRLLKTPTFKFKIQAMRSGVVEAIDAEKVARVALQLGAGREKAADRIDPLAGVTLEVSVGDRVVVGDPLAILESSTSNKMERLAADLLDAFRIKK
jgi:pyrimidine-nucleoside phosphorylase